MVGIIPAARFAVLSRRLLSFSLPEVLNNVTFLINLIALLLFSVFGILFGFMPTRRATRLNSIDAQRHE